MSLKRISLETAKLLDESGLLLSSHVEEGLEDLPFYYYCPEYTNGERKLLDYDYGVGTNIDRNGYKTYAAPTLVEIQMEFRIYHDVDIYVAPDHDYNEENGTYEKYYKVSIDAPSNPTQIYSGFDTYEEALEIGIQKVLELVYDVDKNNEQAMYKSWVGKEIVKHSNKPFKSGLKVGVPKILTINPHSCKQAYLMDDGSIVDCHRVKLNN